ncbi:MAG: hypothetical protein IJB71_00410 [Bacilli bacterium]|nr:hypothetical protein [Bacilli bacterium]
MVNSVINLIEWAFRNLLALVDGLIYEAGARLYDLMIAIAEAKVFEDTTILTVAGRVYQLLGLIMLFKMIFSFLMYVINPDELMDKKKGVGNIIKRIIITLVLIVITPWAFEQSRNLQIYVIDDKVIEYFVFGQSKPSNASAGYNLMYITGKSFVAPYYCANETCEDKSETTLEVCGADWDERLPNIDASGTVTNTSVFKCGHGAASKNGYAVDLYKATTLDGDGHYDLMALMRVGAANSGLAIFDDIRAYSNYQFLWSTLVGIFICYMLLVMCIDMAVRSVKLAFYEMIAPIPIVSYVGFKEGKDSMLNKWFSQCLKTYADLFTRIAGLQIAVFFIDEIADTGFAKNDLFVNIFLILGALTFAKELPKILEGMGVKFGGGGGFNLKKKYSSPGLSMALGAGAGLVGGMAANWQASRQSGRNPFKSTFSALGGAATGFGRGAFAGAKDKDGFGIAKGMGAAGKGGQKIVRNAGTSLGGRVIAGAQQRMGIDTEADRYKKKFDKQDDWQKARKGLEEYASGEVLKDNAFTVGSVEWTDVTGTKVRSNGVNLSLLRAEIQRMQSDSSGRYTAAEIANKQSMLGAAEKEAKIQWINNNLSNSQVAAYFKQLNDAEDYLKMEKSSDFSQISANKKAIEDAVGERFSPEVTKAQKTKEASKPSKN